MKTIRSLICAGVLLVSSACYAFTVGNFVVVKDTTSPYYRQLGTIIAVHYRHHRQIEVDTVNIAGQPVRFTSNQLQGFPVSPRK